MNTALAAASTDGSPIPGLLLLIGLFLLYWVPTIIATLRDTPGKTQVLIVNLFLGWTFIGWVVALVMAFRAKPPAQPEPQQGKTPSSASG